MNEVELFLKKIRKENPKDYFLIMKFYKKPNSLLYSTKEEVKDGIYYNEDMFNNYFKNINFFEFLRIFDFSTLNYYELVSLTRLLKNVRIEDELLISELKLKNPSMTGKELFKSGMNIGGDMIGTMTNTLILSFIGSSLVLVLLYMSSSIKFTDVINIEAIATEAVCAISGSIGIVYTVPITAAIYAFINRDKEIYKVKSENIIKGKRSLKL